MDGRARRNEAQASDRLAWWEEIPLGLALLAQSYVVGLWYYRSISGAAWWADLLVAIGAGLALDLIVVTTVMGRRAGRSSGWSWATSLGAFGCSALIALDRYGWEWRSGLHVAFPLVVFLYSQHLATPRRATPAVASQEAPGATETSKTTQDTTVTQSASSALPVASGQATGDPFLDTLLALPSEPEQPLYTCKHCGSALASKQASGNAARFGCSNAACPGRANRKAKVVAR